MIYRNNVVIKSVVNLRNGISRAHGIIKPDGLEILNPVITDIAEKSVGRKFRQTILSVEAFKKHLHLIRKLSAFGDLTGFNFPTGVFFGGFELFNFNRCLWFKAN